MIPYTVAIICTFCVFSILCSNLTSIIRGPSLGYKGKVVLPFEDNPSSKIGVRFDKPIPDGVDFAGLCDNGHGYFCNGNFFVSLISFHSIKTVFLE